jgi:predicted nucleic acid-binding protein
LTLLDAYALVALVAAEPAAGEVEELLRRGGSSTVVANLAEAVDVSHRVHDFSNEEVRAALEPLLLGGELSAVASEEAEAWLAAEIRGKSYDRNTCALSLADCFLLAHAITGGDEIATADPALAEVARSEGIGVIGLPDSAGARP